LWPRRHPSKEPAGSSSQAHPPCQVKRPPHQGRLKSVTLSVPGGW
jgi:hypothetical protein